MDRKTQGLISYKKGHFSEKIALLYLLLKGYIPLKMNWKVGRHTGAGEVDLICKKGRHLVFVEVKKRTSFDACADSLTPHFQKRQLKAAEFFLNRFPKYNHLSLRFDTIWFAGFRIKHIKDIEVW